MNYQPPSFEFTQSEDNENARDNNKPLSPINRTHRRGNGIHALKPNGRDTPDRKSRGGFRSPRTPTKNASKASTNDASESALLNSGLSAAEMLQRLRKEKEVLVQKHREASADVSSAGAPTGEAGPAAESILKPSAVVPPPPPPNPPPKHKQTVMASPKRGMLAGAGSRNKFEFDDFVFDFDDDGSEERMEGEESHPFDDMFVVVNEGNDDKAIVDREAEVDRSTEKKENNGLVLCKEEANVHEAEDEPQDLPIQQSHSSETSIKSKGSFGSLGSKSVESVGKLVSRGKKVFGRKNKDRSKSKVVQDKGEKLQKEADTSCEGKKKKLSRLELSQLRNLSLMGSRSNSSDGSSSDHDVAVREIESGSKCECTDSPDTEEQQLASSVDVEGVDSATQEYDCGDAGYQNLAQCVESEGAENIEEIENDRANEQLAQCEDVESSDITEREFDGDNEDGAETKLIVEKESGVDETPANEQDFDVSSSVELEKENEVTKVADKTPSIGFNVNRLRQRRESLKKIKAPSVATTVKEKQLETAKRTAIPPKKQKPIDRFGTNKKKAPKINQAMARVNSAMITGTSPGRDRRRRLGASSSVEDENSVSSLNVAPAWDDAVKLPATTSSSVNPTVAKNPTKSSLNHQLTAQKHRRSDSKVGARSVLLTRAQTHRRNNSNTAKADVDPSGELDDAAIFSDLLPLSPRSRDVSVERVNVGSEKMDEMSLKVNVGSEKMAEESLKPKFIRNRFNRGRRSRASSFSNDDLKEKLQSNPVEETSTATKMTGSAPQIQKSAPNVTGVPPQAKKEFSSGNNMPIAETKMSHIKKTPPRIRGGSRRNPGKSSFSTSPKREATAQSSPSQRSFGSPASSTTFISPKRETTAQSSPSQRSFGSPASSTTFISPKRETMVHSSPSHRSIGSSASSTTLISPKRESTTQSSPSQRSVGSSASSTTLISPKCEMKFESSPSPSRVVRRNRSTSRPRLARHNVSPSTKKELIGETKGSLSKMEPFAAISASPLKADTPQTSPVVCSSPSRAASRPGVRPVSGARARIFEPSPAVVNNPDTKIQASTTVDNSKASDEITKSSISRPKSLASLRTVTRRGRPTYSLQKPKESSSLSATPRSVFKQKNKPEMPTKETLSSPFHRRSRSLSRSSMYNESSPKPSKSPPPIKTSLPSPAKAELGSPIEIRHAAATQMRKNHRRRSNSLSGLQPPLQSSSTVARVNKLNKKAKNDKTEPPKAELILHAQYSKSPRHMLDSTSVPSQKAIMSILTSKKKLSFFVPIAQLCQTVLPIQSLARMFLAKLALEKRKDSIVLLQAIFRRWYCEHYLHSIQYMAVQIQACHRGYIAREQTYFFRLGELAVTHLQASYRGMVARRNLGYEAYCATRIQALIRGHWQCIDYVVTWSSVVLVQSVVRMKLARNMFRNVEATKIQACWRSYVCLINFWDDLRDIVTVQCVARKYMAQLLSQRMVAAVKIAASWRGFVWRREFIITVGDLILCQSIARRNIVMKQTDVLRREINATRVQAAWRSYQAYNKFVHAMSDIILVQTIVRRYQAIKTLHRWNKSAAKISSAWRRYYAVREYKCSIAEIVLVQSLARRVSSSRELRRLTDEFNLRRESSSTKISSSWRRHSGSHKYRCSVADIISCQAVIRRRISINKADTLRQQLRKFCATLIQARWRGFVAFEKYIETIFYLLAIQAFARRLIAMKRVHKLREETLIHARVIQFQSLVRRKIAMKKFDKNMKLRKRLQASACTLIQTVYRNYVCRVNIRMHNASTKVQSSYRAFSCRLTYIVTVSSVIVCQSIVRRRIASRKRLQASACTRIQAVYRGHVCRSNIRMHNASTKVQSSYRAFSCRLTYIVTISSVIVCQSIVRRRIAFRQYGLLNLEHYEALKSAATLIQKRIRGYIAFTNYIDAIVNIIICQAVARRSISIRNVQILRERRAATTIATSYRCHAAYSSFNTTLIEIILCQSYVRRWISSRYVDTLRHSLHKSAVIIQSAYRGYTQSVVFIIALSRIIMFQSQLRGHLARVAFVHEKAKRNAAATTIQKYWRSFKVETDFILTLAGIIALQANIRGFIQVMKYSKHQHRRSVSAAKIQSLFRTNIYIDDYIHSVVNVILCQSYVRRWLAHKEALRLIRMKSIDTSAVTIQTRWRGYASRCDFIIALLDIISIQSAVRQWAAMKTVDGLRNQFTSAIKIQAAFRGYIAYSNYVFDLIDIIFCQSVVRANLARAKRAKLQREKAEFRAHVAMQLTSSTVLIQAFIRRHVARKRFAKIKAYDACRNRALIRMKERAAVVVLKRCWDQYKLRKLHTSVTFIQQTWRSRTALKNSSSTSIIRSVIVIQAAIRRVLTERRAACALRYVAISEADNVMMIERKAGIVLQRWWVNRSYLIRLEQNRRIFSVHHGAAVTIQSAFRGYKEFAQYVIVSYYILKIQALMRGHLSRSSLMRRKKLMEQWQFTAHTNKLPPMRQSLPYEPLIREPPSHTVQKYKRQSLPPVDATRRPVPPPPRTPYIAKKIKQRREKNAALVIERFFISIKAEIDREIKNLEEKQRKKGKRNDLLCNTGVTRSSQGLHKPTTDNNMSSTAAHHSVKYPQNSNDSRFSSPQAQYVQNGNGVIRSYSHMHEQHQPGSANPYGRTGQLNYQSKVMNASGYTGQQQSYTSNQGYYNQRFLEGQAPNDSFEYSQKSLDLSQTGSETEVRLAKLHNEVAGLVSRYQVAEDELQSVGHSMGTSSNGKKDRRNSYGSRYPANDGDSVKMRNVDDASRITRGVYQENRGNQPVPSYATPPRKPLEHRLNHLHDVTPPKLSYSQQRMTPTRPPHQHQQQKHSSFHAPVPMRYTHSNPHPQMHYSDQRFPPIPNASQSNLKIQQSNDSFESNSRLSPQITRQNSFGQSPVNRHYPSQQEHQNQGIPQMHYSDQRFPPISYASQSNLKIQQSNDSFESNSRLNLQIPRQNSFGQSPVNRHYPSQQEHQNQGIPQMHYSD